VSSKPGRSVAIIRSDSPVRTLESAIAAHEDIVVHRPSTDLNSDIIDRMLTIARTPGVASASPIPVASQGSAALYALHEASPPPPTLALPTADLCALSGNAIASLPRFADFGGTVESTVESLSEQLSHHGWRHVGTPGVALSWDPARADAIRAEAGWSAQSIASLVGPANTALEAHVSWASSQLDGVRLVVDGACITDDPFTGTQQLVVQIARSLALVRPRADVVLAVRRSQIDSVRSRLAGTPVQIEERATGFTADVVYRPYQMLYAGELDFVLETGRRGLIGQLDMIGFSNASYHPSDQLFFFARNLQRHLMRTLDGVTFISEFGLRTAFAECPDLDRARLHVVSCGTNPDPLAGSVDEQSAADLTAGFIACLSSTFWHKNRSHAIATFAELACTHDYKGALVIGGPEPYFGRSLDRESALLESLPEEVRTRVHQWGHVDDMTKWWLLRHAELILYPSIVEGFGLVPFEAAAVGTPCLAYAGTAPAELLAGTPAVVESWDPTHWADRAAELVSNKDAAAQLVAAVGDVSRRHSWEECAHRTWSAIDHALAAPRRQIHGDDGALLARVSTSVSRRRASGARLRFDIVRGMPAVRRRIGGWRGRRERRA
jgi:glycosyltransferase involved in cell wall biosynthesis